MKIYVYNRCPILDISKVNNLGKEVDFGLFRDRFPDSGWGEMQRIRLEKAKNVDITSELKQTLIEDLAYWIGKDTKKFSEKLKEFNLKP